MKLSNSIYFLILEFALIPIIFLGYIVFSFIEIQETQSTLRRIDDIAQIQKNRLNDVLKNKTNQLDYSISHLREEYIKKTLSSTHLSEVVRDTSGIISIDFVNPTGVIVFSSAPEKIGNDISSEEYFMKGIKQKDISYLHKDPAGSVHHYLSGPIVSNGETLGMIVQATDAQDIIGVAEDYSAIGNTGETLLAVDDGEGNALFITDTRFDQNASLTRVVPRERRDIPAVHAIAGEEGIFSDLVDYREVPVFAATRFVSLAGWGIVVKIDQQEALGPISDLRSLFLILILGTSLLIILLTIPISRAIVAIEESINKEKDEVISLTSHQLKNPITAISWNSELLLNDKKGDFREEQKNMLKDIHVLSKNTLDLIANFLNITKIESGNFAIENEPTDMSKISDLVLEELSLQIQAKKINILKKYDNNIPKLNIGDRAAKTILQNLLTNAVKYTPEKGTVWVSIKRTPDGILLSIKDTGVGIPEEDKKKIFTKLFRAENVAKKTSSGTGLGLYLLKKLVDKLGGKVWFDSTLGEGSVFYVQLPQK